MKLSKKLISILLSVLMVVSMIPFSDTIALADETSLWIDTTNAQPEWIEIKERMPGFVFVHLLKDKMNEKDYKFEVTTTSSTPVSNYSSVFGTLSTSDWTIDGVANKNQTNSGLRQIYGNGYYRLSDDNGGYSGNNPTLSRNLCYFSIGAFEGVKVYIYLEGSSTKYLLYEGTNLNESISSTVNGCPVAYIPKALGFDQTNPFDWKFVRGIDTEESIKTKILNSVTHFPHGCGIHSKFLVSLENVTVDFSSEDSINIIGKLQIINEAKDGYVGGCGIFATATSSVPFQTQFSFNLPRVDRVTPPTGLEQPYNGNEQEIITAGTAEHGTMVYSLDGETWSEELPSQTNVNTYTVYYKVIGDTGYTDTEPATVTARINPIAPIVTAPEGLTKEFNGKAQDIITAGSAIGGTMYYFTTTDENAEPTVNDEGWTTTAPTRTDRAKYYTWYYVKGDANHTDTTPARVTSEIIDDPDDGYNLTLDDGIEVNFLIDTPFYDTEDGFITYEYITDIDTENAAREGGRIDVEELTTYTSGDVYNGDRKLTLKAAPAQIAEDFVVKVYAKDADPTKDEPVSQYTVSIEDYCTTIINNAASYSEANVNLAKSILNYGQLANEYFGYAAKHAEVNPTDDPYVVTTVGDYQADLTEAELNDIRSKASASIVNQGSVAIRGVTYITQMDPEFRFYLGTDVTEAQAAAMTLTVSEGLQARMINTKWGICVSVTGLKSNEFGRVFTLTVGDTTINYNGYAYLASVFKDGTNNSSQLLKNLAKGIYRYSVACNEAFA